MIWIVSITEIYNFGYVIHWYFPSLIALRKAQPRWAIKIHFKKSLLFWYLLNRRLFNSFKSWDFFCVDRIKYLSAMSDKACNFCSQIYSITVCTPRMVKAIYNFFVFLKKKIHESKIFSQQYFLLSTWKNFSFSSILRPEFLLIK